MALLQLFKDTRSNLRPANQTVFPDLMTIKSNLDYCGRFFCKRQILLLICPYKLFWVQQTKLIIAPVANVLTVSVVFSKKFITLEPSPPGPKSPKNFFYGPPKRRDQSFVTQQLVSSWI